MQKEHGNNRNYYSMHYLQINLVIQGLASKRIVEHQHGRRPSIWKTNMVAVTSHVKTLYLEKQIDQKGPARTTLPRHLLI